MEVLIQQDMAVSQCKARHQLLQEGNRINKCTPRHSGRHLPKQLPCPERIGLLRTQVGGHEDGEEPKDDITIGTEYSMFDECKVKTRVPGAKLKQDMVWLWCESGDEWGEVVVDVQVTSTDKLNEAFRERMMINTEDGPCRKTG